MEYFVKRIDGGNYSSEKLLIKLNTEVPVTKEQYEYLNDTFGASGYFTFRTEDTSVKPVKEEKTKPSKAKATKRKTKEDK